MNALCSITKKNSKDSAGIQQIKRSCLLFATLMRALNRISKSSASAKTVFGHLKPRPNDSNISTQNIANNVGHSMLCTFDHLVAMCCDMLQQVGVVGPNLKMVTFFKEHLWMLHDVVFVWPGSYKFVASGIRTSSLFHTQHVATCCNKMAKNAQHVAPNNVAICCVQMLQLFGRNLQMLGQQ